MYVATPLQWCSLPGFWIILWGFQYPECVVSCRRMTDGWLGNGLETKKLKKTKLCGFNPQANYTDRATAACRRSYCQLLQIEGVVWSAQWIPMTVNLDFLDTEPLFFPSSSSSLYSQGWVDPVPDPLLHRKSGSAGNRTRDLWICSQELWLLDHRRGLEMVWKETEK
jgi:hypothetical protein